MGNKSLTENGNFFSKNFNILNLIVQSGILLTILSVVFKSGVYYDQVNKLVEEIVIIEKNIDELKGKIVEFDKKIDSIIKDNQLEDSKIKKNEEQIDSLQKCQRNKKNC